MAPAADMKWSEQAMQESFYMSNICPQNQKLNRDDWGDLEEMCRNWAKNMEGFILPADLYTITLLLNASVSIKSLFQTVFLKWY